ncbi:MAG TPA: SHOCT domain-containing protein [Streptosporangiaceae bacterium]|nr:SHOCT domain-containing protein [Streptosporangiaceae bacterium]
MFARRRPLLRAAVVGGGAYVAGKKMGQRQGQQQGQEGQSGQSGQSQASVPSQATSSESAQQTVSDQLAKLSSLHQQGALNDAEFATAKAKLLGS